jgi:HEAT repeat protein
VPPLIQALGDRDRDVRVAACRALGAIGDGQAVPALSVWTHAGRRVAQEALQQMGQAPLPLPEALAQVVAQGAWGVLVRALPHEAVRAAVVELGTPAVPHLIQALRDGNSYVRVAACRALGAIGDRQAVPPLIQALGDRDRDRDVRAAACWALGQIGDPQAIPPLIQALGDWNSDVRVVACRALGAIGDRQAVPPLIQALGDWNSDVRVVACRALGAIGDGQAVPALSVWAHAGEQVAQAALQQMGQAPLPLPEALAQVVAQGAWGVLVRALRMRRCAQRWWNWVRLPCPISSKPWGIGIAMFVLRRVGRWVRLVIPKPSNTSNTSSKPWRMRMRMFVGRREKQLSRSKPSSLHATNP